MLRAIDLYVDADNTPPMPSTLPWALVWRRLIACTLPSSRMSPPPSFLVRQVWRASSRLIPDQKGKYSMVPAPQWLNKAPKPTA